MKILSKLKSGKWIGCFIQGEWNWPISCLNDSETQERGHERVQIQNFPGEHVRAPSRSFSVRLVNWSVFILDACLSCVLIKHDFQGCQKGFK